MDEQTLKQIWPVFLAEARDHLQEISAGVLDLEQGPIQTGTLEAVRRTAHSLKGAAASLSFGDIEQLAHAIEGSLAGCDAEAGLGAARVEGILHALQGIESVLDETEAGRDAHVPDLAALVSRLAGEGPAPAGASSPPAKPVPARPEGPLEQIRALEGHLQKLCSPNQTGREAEIASAAEAAARLAESLPSDLAPIARRIGVCFEHMRQGGNDAARAAAEIAGHLVDLQAGPARKPGAPAGKAPPAQARERRSTGAPEKTIRIGAATIEALARNLETIATGESRHERRAREILAQEGAVKEVLRLLGQCASELRLASGESGMNALGEAIQRLRHLSRELLRVGRDTLRDSDQQRLVSAAVREDLRDIRMVPAALALEPLRRTVRDVASRMGKEVELRLVGGEVRLDRRVLDELKAPLVQLARNAVDHGIEPPEVRRAAGKNPRGLLEVRVEPRGSRIAVILADDGAGLSLERIRSSAVQNGLLTAAAAAALPEAEVARLIFRSGVSSSAEVTAISGRGVGLDLVHESVTRLQGSVEVSFAADRETRFVLDLPLTLAATMGVVFRAGGELGALPAAAVERSLRLKPEDLGTIGGQATVKIGSAQLPFVSMAQVLGLSPAPMPARSRSRPALVLSLGGHRTAFGVDEILGQQELVVSSLGARASHATHLAGASVLDNGEVVGVLNPAEILRRARPTSASAEPAQKTRRQRILVADDSLTTRAVMKSILEIAGFMVLPASDGEEALSILRNSPCQLVVSDIQMPRLDGLSLTRLIKGDPRLATIPVILVTSLDAPERRAAGLQAGADGYLVKREVERGQLLELVRQLLPVAA